MKVRLLTLFVVLASCLLAALSTGSKIYLLFALLLGVMAVLAFASVLVTVVFGDRSLKSDFVRRFHH